MDPVNSLEKASPKKDFDIFDSLMSIPSTLAESVLGMGVEALTFVKGLAKGVANILLPSDNNNSEPQKE